MKEDRTHLEEFPLGPFQNVAEYVGPISRLEISKRRKRNGANPRRQRGGPGILSYFAKSLHNNIVKYCTELIFPNTEMEIFKAASY